MEVVVIIEKIYRDLILKEYFENSWLGWE